METSLGPHGRAPRRALPALGFGAVLASAFVFVVALAAAAPLVLSERTVGTMRRSEVKQQFHLMSTGVQTRFEAQLGSADVVLDTLSTCLVTDTADEATGIRLARTLSDLRETSPMALAIVFAKDDGSFSLARAVTASTRGKAQAAGVPGAAFEVQVGASRGGALYDAFVYVDRDFRVLARTAPIQADYDSRNRLWYVLARSSDRAVVTPPYRFQDYAVSGLTMSRKGGRGGADVFGVDVTLDDLSTSLRQGVVFDGEQASIVEDDGWLVADSRVTGLPILLGTPGDPLRSRRAEGLERAEAVFRAFRRDPNQRDLDLELAGGRMLANFATLRFDNREFIVASTLPYAVLEGPVLRSTRWALALECAVAVLALSLAYGVAAAMSVPITALAADVEGIVAFRGPRSVRSPSRLREVRRLSDAVDTLELALTAFATYAPPRLVMGIVERGTLPDVGGARREVVVMFSDIEGFTSLSEDVTPTVLAAQLCRHLSAVAEAVTASGGTLDKFIGDSVMAFWDGADAAAAACAAAVSAAARVGALNDDFAREGLDPMRSRFGLHRGEAMLGNIGVPGRMSYTVLGHAVNVASRIEALNKDYGTTILVSGAVVDAAGDAFGFEHVADRVVRGGRTAVGLFKLAPRAASGLPAGMVSNVGPDGT